MPVTRRRLLTGLASSIAVAPFLNQAWAQGAKFQTNPFTLGVASGDPDATSVVLWTRLAPSPLENRGGMPSDPVAVDWEIAEDDKMQTVVKRGTVNALPAEGHSLHVVADGLTPNRPYWYRFMSGGAESRIGRTRTLPAAGVIPERYRIVSAGCQRIEHGYFTAWAEIAKSDIDLVYFSGDYIYEYALPEKAVEKRMAIEQRMGRPIPSAVLKRLSDLSEFRLRYALYKLDPDLAAAHAAHPFVTTFDDHEVVNDWAGMFLPGKMTQNDLIKIRTAAFQAFYENTPVRPSVRPNGPNITAYQSFEVGGLLRLASLDTRQYRSLPGCGKYDSLSCEERKDPNRTMIGADQERWLFDQFGRNNTTWTVLGSQVLMMQRRIGEPAKDVVNTDKWDGNAASRARVLQAAVDRKVSGLVVLSGDFHKAFAGNLKVDFDKSDSPTMGVELLSSSISSDGDADGNIAAAAKRLYSNNPHFKFYDDRRGYTVCDFAKDRCTATFRAVKAVSKPNEPISTIRTFEFSADRPSLS